MRYMMIVVSLAAMAAVTPATADRGFIIGGGVATANMEARGLDDDDLAYHVAAGWQFSDYVQVEGNYLSLGNFSSDVDANTPAGTIVNADIDAFAAKLRLTLSLSDAFVVYGDVGALIWDAKWQEQLAGGGTVNLSQLSINDDGTDFVWGAGAALRVTNRLSLRGGWNRYKAGALEVDTIGLDFYFRLSH